MGNAVVLPQPRELLPHLGYENWKSADDVMLSFNHNRAHPADKKEVERLLGVLEQQGSVLSCVHGGTCWYYRA